MLIAITVVSNRGQNLPTLLDRASYYSGLTCRLGDDSTHAGQVIEKAYETQISMPGACLTLEPSYRISQPDFGGK